MKLQLTVCFLLVGLRLVGANLDDALKSFLSSSMGRSSAAGNVHAVKNLFELYKKEFNRSSMARSGDRQRLASFNETLNSLIDHSRQNGKTFTAGLNEYADWTHEELSKLRGVHVPHGQISATNAKSGERFLKWNGSALQSRASAPASYDLTAGMVPETSVPLIEPIKSQGGCGSCYAFALISLLEFQFATQLKKARNLSEQQMVDCSTLDKGCGGGYFTRTFEYLRKNQWQVDSGTSYPYVEEQGQCAFKGQGGGGVRFGPLRYKQVGENDATAMRQALVDYGPLWVSVFAGNKTTTYKNIMHLFSEYRKGILQFTGCPTSIYETNHAVVIVGYGVDSATNLPYWKVRNSWGQRWGESGYFRIRRGVNMCGIESGPFFIARTV